MKDASELVGYINGLDVAPANVERVQFELIDGRLFVFAHGTRGGERFETGTVLGPWLDTCELAMGRIAEGLRGDRPGDQVTA